MDNLTNGLAITLPEEGGYADIKGDPGGSTDEGVTQATYDAYRKSKGEPTQDVRKISAAELQDIYNTRYWLAAACDKLPTGVDVQHFDTAVNAGVSEAGKILQRSVGALGRSVTIDGVVGDSTVAAVNMLNMTSLINEYATQRLAAYRTFSDWAQFGAAWSGRIGRVKTKSLALYTASIASRPAVDKLPVQPTQPIVSPRPAQSGFVAFLRALWQRWFGTGA